MSSKKVNLSEAESKILEIKGQIEKTKKTNRSEYKNAVLKLMDELRQLNWTVGKNGIITIKNGNKDKIELSEEVSQFVLNLENNLFSTLYNAESKKGLTGKIPDFDARAQRVFLTLIELGYTVEGEINEDGTCKMIQFSKGKRKREISQKLKSLPFELKGKKYVLTKEGLVRELELATRINELTALMRDINSCSDINIKQSKISELINNPAIRFDGEKYIININGSIMPLLEAQNQFLLSLDDNLPARIVDKRKGALKVYLINQINQKREELYNVGNLNFEDGIIGEYHMSVQKSFQSIPYATEVLAKGIELDDSSLLLEKLKRNGFDFNFEEESMSIDGAKTVELSDDIIEKLQQLGIYYQNDSEITKKIKTIQMNILSNMVEALDGTKLTKSELKNKSIVLSDVPDYELDIDSYGSMFVTIENKKYYLPLAFSRKMLSLGALQDEQVIIKHLEGFVPELFGEFQNNRKDNNYDECRKICKRLIAELNDDEISTEYSKGKYTVTSKKTGKTVQLSSEYSSFLSELEETLFNTIYNAEKDSDVDGQKSVVQDVNAYNTLIQMMELGYNFYINTDKDDNIEQDEVIIISPTKKEIIRDVSDFDDIKTGELPWTASKDKKASNTLIMEKVELYKELAEYINNKIYPAIEAAEKNLDGNGDNLQIELSIKYLLEALNPNDGDKLTSYVNGVYVIVSEKNEIAISLDKTLSEKIDRLTKEYIEILYQNNKTTSKKPSNEQGNSKEDIIEDIRSYFADEGTEIEDIENKMSPVFDENGERISIDFNAQKTIIQLMELGYRFAVEEGTIKITSPCGNTFDASTEDFKQKGLPYTQSIFNLIQRFAKSEEKGKDYSTKNYYDFLYGLAEIEDKFKIMPKITKKRQRYLKEENQVLEERKREVADYVNNIIRKIEEIKKLPLEEGHGQLISFYQQLKENKQFRMKLKCENSVDDELGIYEIYDCTTDDLSTLSDQVLYTMSKEKSEDIGAIGGVLADYLLKANDTEQSEFRIETSQWNGIVQLLEIGFTLKSDKIDNQNVIKIYDPFGTYTKLYIPDKENNNVNRSPEETIKHFKELVMFAERINEQIVPLFENTDEDFKSVNCFELLRRTRELKNSNDISFDSIPSGKDDKKMYFINPQNGKKIPLSEKHAELLYEIRKVLGNDELYIRLQNIIEGKPIEDGMGIDNKLIVPNNETYEDKVFNSYRMYKQLRAFGLDMEAYEGGFKRLVLITPWNDKIGEIRPNSVSLLTENPISSELTKSNPTNKEIEMLHLLFSQGMQKTLDLFEECYDSGMNNKEEIMKFLIERAKTVYERKQVAENPIITVGRSAIFRAQQTINGIRSGWPNLPRRIGYIRGKNQNPQGDKNHKRLRTGVGKDD